MRPDLHGTTFFQSFDRILYPTHPTKPLLHIAITYSTISREPIDISLPFLYPFIEIFQGIEIKGAPSQEREMDQILDKAEWLMRVPIFSELDLRRRKKLAKLCDYKHYEVGAPIVAEGSIGMAMYMIHDGLIEVFKTERGEKISLGTLSAGDVLGEMSLIDDAPRSASAVAVKKSQGLLLTRDNFRRLVKRDTEIAWSIVPILATRIRNLNDHLMKAAESPVAKTTLIAAAEPVVISRVVAAPKTIIDTPVVTEDAFDKEVEPEDEASVSRFLGLTMRVPFAAMFAGVTIMSEIAGSCEASLEAFAKGTGLSAGDEPREVFRQLPNGLMCSTKQTLKDSLKIPGRTVKGLRGLFTSFDSENPEAE